MFRKLALLSMVVAAAAAAAVLGLSELRLRRTFALPDQQLPVGPLSLARGAHLFESVGCASCHGADGGGAVYLDAGPIGLAVGPNLTAGEGGIGSRRTIRDLARAIRWGVRPDGTSLLVMPSEVYANLSDGDLAALVRYVRSLPAVDRTLPSTHLRILGRALLAVDKLDLRSAPKAIAVERRAPVAQGPTSAYGRYLADIASCRACHRPNLGGGPMAAPGAPPAPDITPARLAGWQEADFVTLMRTGQRPDGSMLHTIMPWASYRRMTDDELRALWLYLRSVPATGSLRRD